LVLLAGGTGITPMLQIASSTLLNPTNQTHITLLSFSSDEKDICLHEDLVRLQERGADHCTLKFFASTLPAASARQDVAQGSLRKFTAQQLLEHAAGVPVSETTMFCMCGPRDFIDKAKKLLSEGGVPDSRVLAWEEKKSAAELSCASFAASE
jgi:cytochrome-b5 reductase